MSWDYFALFAIVALLFWGLGAFAAWRGKRPVVVYTLTCLGLAVFFSFIVGMWISLERPPMRTMGETRLWYSFFLPLAGIITGGLLDRDILLHIGAEGDQNAHGDGQRVEHLPHGGDHGHPGEVFGVGHQKILHTRQCTGTGDRVARNDQRQHHQHRHHHLGDALYAVQIVSMQHQQT